MQKLFVTNDKQQPVWPTVTHPCAHASSRRVCLCKVHSPNVHIPNVALHFVVLALVGVKDHTLCELGSNGL